ncbi:MAG TPA: CRTAC1 family protein [Clostridia bacterium]|nr:CRTAC1 family protein [Clostridia bacterium]
MKRRRTVALGALAGVLLVLVTVAGWAASRGSGAGSQAGTPPRFVEEAEASGLDHRYDGEFTFFTGGGVAAFDCDDDGRQDLYFAGGERPAALYRNESPVGGSLRFARLADSATDLDAVTGAYPIDIDSDGHLDLAVLRLGENVLLRGIGQCRFERANETFGLDGGEVWTAAFSATWEAGSRLPTLAFGNYLELDPDRHWTGRCLPNHLVRPAAGGMRYDAPVELDPGWCALSVLFSDWDRAGRADLRVSNDRHYYADTSDGEEQLWRIVAGEPPRLYDRDDGWQTVRVMGMGIASHDVTGDGKPEVFLTSQGDNKLQSLADDSGQPRYSDIALRRGVTAHRPFAGGDIHPSTAWHPEFADVNNDGLVDLFVTKGNVEAQPDYAMRDPSNLLLGQADGSFVEAAEAAGVLSYARARGAALVDLNLDGLLDLVVVNRREQVKAWRNVGSGTSETPRAPGHWLAVALEQSAPNVDAVGAWLEIRAGDRTIVREVTVGGGHAGGQIGWIHAGLGAADQAEVRVTWPGGEAGPWLPVDADQFVRVRRGESAAEPWLPPTD